MGRLTRRKFVAGALAAGAGLVASRLVRGTDRGSSQAAPLDLTPQAYLPLVVGSDLRPQVVHVRDADATAWGGTGSGVLFYNAVSQPVVNAMVQAGLEQLTGQTSWADIWQTLFARVQPNGYVPGQKIAIKANFNNCQSVGTCASHDNHVDALPQPVIGLLSGMVAAGVQASDIVAYDSLRAIPSYFRNPLTAAFPGITFVGSSSFACSGVLSATHGSYPSLTVHFTHPQGNIDDRKLADVLYDSTYLINMPILKRHEGGNGIPVTLGFKNHLGSLNRITGSDDDDLHSYLRTGDATYYRSTYCPLADIYANVNIRDKTILTVGDGLYGAFGPGAWTAEAWESFDDAPNSLFFATDPVAADCVMTDLLVAEGEVNGASTYDFLFCAAEAGLGVCEGTREQPGGDPWQMPFGSGYAQLHYKRVDL